MAMRGLLITGTDSGVGKTLIGCALAFAGHARGIRVGVMKPAEIGCAEIAGALEPSDARALIFAAASDLPLGLVCPYRYRSTLAPAAAAEADKLAPPDLDEIANAYRKIAARSDLVIVEGTGGIGTPLLWGKDFADLARILALEAVIVVENRSCINAAMLTFHYARSRGLAIAGWILNDVEPAAPAAETIEASIRRISDVRFLGRVRFKQPVPREVIDPLLSPR